MATELGVEAAEVTIVHNKPTSGGQAEVRLLITSPALEEEKKRVEAKVERERRERERARAPLRQARRELDARREQSQVDEPVTALYTDLAEVRQGLCRAPLCLLGLRVSAFITLIIFLSF